MPSGRVSGQQKKEGVDPGRGRGAGAVGADGHLQNEEHVERGFQAGVGVEPDPGMNGDEQDSDEGGEWAGRCCAQTVHHGTDTGEAEEFEEERGREVQERGDDAERGVDGAGVGLFVRAGGVPVPDVVGDEVFAVAEADVGVVDGELEVEDGPEEGGEERDGEDGGAFGDEPVREGGVG